MRLVTVLIALCSIASAVTSPQTDVRKKDDARIFDGCVNGSRRDIIRVDRTGSTIDHLTLRGDKDMMKTLTKDLNGHRVEVTGVLSDPHNKQGRGKTIQIGKKTTITTGARDVPDVPDPATDATLKVTTFRDIDPDCRVK